MTLSEKLEGSTMFQIGNRVIRRNKPEEIGTVINVITNIQRTPEFAMYDVEFASSRCILHGYELRALYSSCKEWRQLSRVCQKASAIYFRVVLDLTNAAGTVGPTEFELLRRRVESARQVCKLAHERLKQHTADHGC